MANDSAPSQETAALELMRWTKTPSNLDATVWRYMDFTKFVAMLESGVLYFARSDQLGDPFEGSYPRANFEGVETMAAEIARLPADTVIDEGARSMAKHHPAVMQFLKKFAKHCFVNCWHMNEQESAAMWRLYLKSDEGIAIQSTYRRLTSSLPPNRALDSDPESIFHISEVNYINYDKTHIPIMFPLNFILHKRKSFEHEHELRVVFQKGMFWNENDMLAPDPNLEEGIRVPVDLGLLIQNVFVSPSAPPWFSGLVESVTRKYGLSSPVVKSSLSERPLA